jgi:hypothetical protein
MPVHHDMRVADLPSLSGSLTMMLRYHVMPRDPSALALVEPAAFK